MENEGGVTYPYELREAAAGVWSVRLAWTRVYVLTDGTKFSLVDSGTRWDRALLLGAIEKLGLGVANCESVLLTHGHCDHAGNAAFFAETYGARLVAHVDEAPFIETRRTYVPRGWKAIGVKGLMFGGGEIVYPVRRHPLHRRLVDGDVVDTPAGLWRVVHTPGHSVGHIAYFREADGALLSGDALLTVIPFRRVPGLALAPPLFGTSLAEARASARRLARLQPQTLLPGHGAPMRDDTASRVAHFVARLRGW